MAKATPAKKSAARKAVAPIAEAAKAKATVRKTEVPAPVATERTRKLHERRNPAERMEQLRGVLGKQINKGMAGLKRAAIAEAAGVSTGLITKYFGSVEATEKLAMELAHKAGNHKAIARCVKDGYPMENLPRSVQAKVKAL